MLVHHVDLMGNVMMVLTPSCATVAMDITAYLAPKYVSNQHNCTSILSFDLCL